MTGQPSIARTEFAAAINQISNERGIDANVIIAGIEDAILAAFRKDRPDLFPETEEEVGPEYKAEIDPQTGAAKIIEIASGDDVTPPGFGRIAAQTAKQVILQRVREAERDAIIGDYTDKVGTLLSAMVLRYDGKNVIFDIGRGQGFMPPEEQIPSEYYRLNQRMAVYLQEIRDTLRGKTMIVSRACPETVIELFRREVPEVASGAVEIVSIAREPGHRTKIAVISTQDGVDPVGSCVGQKGVRVQEVINELGGEKIDIIQHSHDSKVFITAALAPAEQISLEIDEPLRKATVMVPEDQLSLAIGKGGQNVRLAAKLTGYKLTIVGEAGESIASATEAGEATGEAVLELNQLELSPRTIGTLVKANVTTIQELAQKITDGERIDGIGPKSADEIKEALAKHQA